MGGNRAKDARATLHEKADAVATIRTRPKQHLLSIGHRAFTLIVLIQLSCMGSDSRCYHFPHRTPLGISLLNIIVLHAGT